MKRLEITLFIFLATWQCCPVAAAEPVKLPIDTYSGYFVSNRFKSDATELFLVITDQKQFDEVFGIPMVIGDKSHRLPKDAFKSNVVLASVKIGKAVWQFKTDGVTVDDGVVRFRYTTTSKESDSSTFACPLIVSIPKGQYKAVEFIENKKPVKRIELGGK